MDAVEPEPGDRGRPILSNRAPRAAALGSPAAALLLALAMPGCLLVSLATPSALPEGGVHREDLRYYGGPGYDRFRHALDVYAPPGPGPHPVVVFIHGGGWRTGDRDGAFGVYRRLGRRLASLGIVAVIPGYRLAPDHKHPAQVRDVARAIGWTVQHAASFGGDPRALFVMGHSAGAHLAALAALDRRWLAEQGLRPDALSGVIAISGPYDLRDLSSEAAAMVEGAFGGDPEAWFDATPATHLSPGTVPPFLITVAEDDPEVLLRGGRVFAEALRGAGVPVEEHTIAGRSHNSILVELGRAGEPLTDLVLGFTRAQGPAQPVAAGDLREPAIDRSAAPR